MKKRLINHVIAIIGIAVLAFLAIASGASIPAEREAFNRGENADRAGNYDQAIKEYTEAIKINPNYWPSYYNRGMAYKAKGDLDQAIADFTEVIRLVPVDYRYRSDYYRACEQRGMAYEAKGDIDSAIADYNRMIELDRAEGLTGRSSAQVRLEKLQQANGEQNAPSPTQAAPAQIIPVQPAPTPAIPAAQGNNLNEKFAWLQIFAQSNNSYLLEVNANESISSQNLLYNGKDNITLILRGVGANRRISGGDFEIRSGVTLILDNNITLLRGVTVRSGGTLIMNTGSALNGNGVFLDRGTFTMNGGTISGCQNSGVRSSGTFIMNGGTISSNRVESKGGGGVLVSDGTFTMNGGTISGNNHPIQGSGGGGGVLVAYDSDVSRGGTFIMNGGTISGNTTRGNGGGVYVEWGTRGTGIFTMNGGTISGNTAVGGGGVYNSGIFTMSDGTISGNTATGSGGGIYTPGGTFTKTGGTITGYTSDQRNGNVVKNSSGAVQNYRGHAVWAGSSNTLLKIREGTAGPGDNLAYNSRTNPPTASGAWDN